MHGVERRESVERVTNALFGGGDFTALQNGDIEALSAEIPTVATGVTVIEALVEAGVVASNGEARRLISGGGVSVNGKKIGEDLTASASSLIKKGKNSFVLVR